MPGTRAVFLSYRREETRHIAGRLADRLTERLGSTQVFMDVDTIEPGADFAAAIAQEVAACDVLIALIGPTWSTVADRRGRRRLDDPDDFVVLEIRAALEREIRVIPVLVDGAVMPDRYDLPEGLQDLARRNAVRLDHETFRSDVATLLDAVERILSTLAPTAAAEPTARIGARTAKRDIDKKQPASEADGLKLQRAKPVRATFDAAAVDCRVSVFRDGPLTSFGYDVTFRVMTLSLEVGDDDTIKADFDAGSLRVATEAPREQDRKDIEKNTEKTLEVRKYPKIQFRSVTVVRDGDRARIEGDLTLHGVTAPISIEARDDGQRWNAKIIIDQRTFGIKPFSAMLGALRIKPEVEVNISVPHP